MSASNLSRIDNFIKTATVKSNIGAKGILNTLDIKLHYSVAP